MVFGGALSGNCQRGQGDGTLGLAGAFRVFEINDVTVSGHIFSPIALQVLCGL